MNKSKSLIQKQIALLTTIAELAEAATVCDNQDILIYTKDNNGHLVPVTSEQTQGLILTDAVVSEVRGGALEALDMSVAQLEAIGITISENALAEIVTTNVAKPEV